jgi:hypothetical protein
VGEAELEGATPSEAVLLGRVEEMGRKIASPKNNYAAEGGEAPSQCIRRRIITNTTNLCCTARNESSSELVVALVSSIPPPV